MTNRIGIFGASGFVGSTLCERLFFQGNRDFLPFVHSSGNAWRVARLGLPLRPVDLLDRDHVRDAVASCDVVVNCALGNDAARTRGLKNLLEAARRTRLRKFIHLSSIAIYGQDPLADTTTESARPNPGANNYAIAKLRQDEMVMDLHRAGVPCYLLVPGNISGPYSSFVRGLIERLARGPFPLVDGGGHPSNLIHVDNLVEAILAALRSDTGAGERYFVNEERPVSWRQLCDDLGRLVGREWTFVHVTREEVLPFLNLRRSRVGAAGHIQTALSGEFRRAISRLPVFGVLERFAAAVFQKLDPRIQQRIRQRLDWPVRITRSEAGPFLGDRYATVQVRRFYHSPDKLRRLLGWRPPLSYERGLETTAAWIQVAGIRE